MFAYTEPLSLVYGSSGQKMKIGYSLYVTLCETRSTFKGSIFWKVSFIGLSIDILSGFNEDGDDDELNMYVLYLAEVIGGSEGWSRY
jgi:hypothetical protein